ncbi:MAG: HEPN domain-containing protein [Chitinophagaceae bacterium]|nr:HEPN domain-containing protein [Chitinophagaceae bacterium]
MNISLPLTTGFLPRSQQQLMAELIGKIVEAVHPEKIICYGIRSAHYQDWGCFLDVGGIKEDTRLSLDLLIIASAAKGKAEQDISQAAEQVCQPWADVHCITHKIHTVNNDLAKGVHFFCALYQRGMVVYDSGGTSLLSPGRMEGSTPEKAIIEGIWTRWFGLALNFFKSAEESLKYERPDLTAFMLHQAVEHTCGALIRVFTGYRPNTHNLTRLLMMVESFTRQLHAVFPRVTKEEEEIYGILQRGYLDARYKEDYTVPPAMLGLLLERVERLQSLAAGLYNEKLSRYNSSAFSTMAGTLDFP